MQKRLLSLLLLLTLIVIPVACTAPDANSSSQASKEENTEAASESQDETSAADDSNAKEDQSEEETNLTQNDYKIGILTPTLSSSEDEYRAGENMAKKYPGVVIHLALPEDTNENPQGGISQILSLADDPEVKAIVVASGQAGLIPAFQEIKEKRPDILTITAPIWDDPELMAKYIDINLDTDWIRRGQTIVEKAKDMGAKTFIHYSFPTHLSVESVAKRRDMMKETCDKLGITFVEEVTPDPQTGDGTTAMLQFLREDIPRQIEKYGKDTNIFGSNCPMYDVILDEALKLKFIVAEQCCPTPTQAFPAVMNLEISEEDAGNFEKMNEMIKAKAAEAGMTGRLSGWPIPVTIFLPEYSVELAKYTLDNNLDVKQDVLQKDFLNKFSEDIFGIKVDFEKINPDSDNYYMMIMESIFY